ncbi:DNA polymerase III subunit epsilon [Neptuniibacter sp. SY11_33]|uniref:DNA polymerase III subunit epsilon n=1 Tax=Neptuniibacter sp. SY11_33 TaxID=3398215 RepID=UPI0039F48A17
MSNRLVILDTETTGMNQESGPHFQGHRIIEIGCVEVINRKLTGNTFHVYINPEMPIDPEAIAVHGITDEQVKDCPKFAEIAQEFAEFLDGSEMIAHNAPFDVGFMDHEFGKLGAGWKTTDELCKVTDSLKIAKDKFPGQKNNLDALCRRLGIDNSHRELHGALLDAEILADVYLLMTGGQTSLMLSDDAAGGDAGQIRRHADALQGLPLVTLSDEELAEHEAFLNMLDKKAGGSCTWRQELVEAE